MRARRRNRVAWVMLVVAGVAGVIAAVGVRTRGRSGPAPAVTAAVTAAALAPAPAAASTRESATRPASMPAAASGEPLIYDLTVAFGRGKATTYRVTLPAGWEAGSSCRGSFGLVRRDAKGREVVGSENSCDVGRWPDGGIEIDLAVDITDTYSRVNLRKVGEGYEGTFKAFSAFNLDKVSTGPARLTRVRSTTKGRD